MLEQTKRISFRISSVLYWVEPDFTPAAAIKYQLRPAPALQHWIDDHVDIKDNDEADH